MEKKIVEVFGRRNFLLGKDKNGIKYYLEEPHFDCGWYWGGLYIETFTNNNQPTRSVDISSHQHFDSMFLMDRHIMGSTAFKAFFKESVLDEHEIYRLITLAETFYTLRQAADLMHCSESRQLSDDCYDVIKDREMYKNIVTRKIPAVISDILNLLGGNTTAKQYEKEAENVFIK